MPHPTGGLGRGLGSLIQRTDQPAPETPQARAGNMNMVLDAFVGDDTTQIPEGSRYAEVPIDHVVPNPRQPRQVFDEDALNELVESITEVGLLQPVVVRPLDDGRFELVMGERRLRASKLAGLSAVPAIVRDTKDHDMLRDALLENLHRAQLNPLEEAAAYQQMLEDFGCTQEELATRIKRSRPQISNTIRLLKLPAPVQRRVAAGVLTAGHARAILMLDDPLAQERLAQRIVAEALSVRAAEEAAMMRAEPEAERAPRTKREPSERAVELARDLSDRFDTRVKVDIGAKRGKIVIEFAGPDDLDRILAELAP